MGGIIISDSLNNSQPSVFCLWKHGNYNEGAVASCQPRVCLRSSFCFFPKLSESFADCQDFLELQDQEFYRLKLQHALDLKVELEDTAWKQYINAEKKNIPTFIWDFSTLFDKTGAVNSDPLWSEPHMSCALSAPAGAAGPKRKQNSRCFSSVLGSSPCTRSPSRFPPGLRQPLHGMVGDALAPREAHMCTIVYLAAQTHSQHICLAFKSTSSYSCSVDGDSDD